MAQPPKIDFDENFAPAVLVIARDIADDDADRNIQLRLSHGSQDKLLASFRIARHDDDGRRREQGEIAAEINEFVHAELKLVCDAPLGHWVYFVLVLAAATAGQRRQRRQRQFRAIWGPELRAHRLSLQGEHRLQIGGAA